MLDTVHMLRADLSSHQREYAAETRLTREAIEDLRDGQKGILAMLGGINRMAWLGLGAVCLVILSGVTAVVASNFTAHDGVAHYTIEDAARLEAAIEKAKR